MPSPLLARMVLNIAYGQTPSNSVIKKLVSALYIPLGAKFAYEGLRSASVIRGAGLFFWGVSDIWCAISRIKPNTPPSKQRKKYFSNAAFAAMATLETIQLGVDLYSSRWISRVSTLFSLYRQYHINWKIFFLDLSDLMGLPFAIPSPIQFKRGLFEKKLDKCNRFAKHPTLQIFAVEAGRCAQDWYYQNLIVNIVFASFCFAKTLVNNLLAKVITRWYHPKELGSWLTAIKRSFKL